MKKIIPTILFSVLLFSLTMTAVLPFQTVYSQQPPDFETVALLPEKDSFLTQGSAKDNEGANTIVRIISSDKNRPIIAFDQNDIDAALVGGNLESSTLRLFIVDNGNNWGPNGRFIGPHQILEDWTEGNGWNVGNNISGSGTGVTWNCSNDTDISNNQDDCLIEWDGGNIEANPTNTVLITNDLINQFIEIDVTQDVQEFIDGTETNFGWMVKKDDEAQNGSIEFASKESTGNISELELVISPKITWIPDTLNVEASNLALFPLNFTVGKFVSEVDVSISNEIEDLVAADITKFFNLNSGVTHEVPVSIQIQPDTTSGWHNGTISLSSNGFPLNDSLNFNILVPQITTEIITTSEGNFTKVAMPSFSDFVEETYNVSIYFTFNNGTTILLHQFYDVFVESGGTTQTSFESPNYFHDLVFVISEGLATIQNALSAFFVQIPIASAVISPVVPEDQCTKYAFTYHFEEFPGKELIDIPVAKDALSVSDRNPLIIRNDIRWGNLDKGMFVGDTWVSDFTNAGPKIDAYFNTLPSDTKAIVILSVQDPPSPIASKAPLPAGRTSAHYTYHDEANDFVEFTVNYIKDNGLLDRVEFWQIDNEPNIQVPTKLVSDPFNIIKIKADWELVTSGLVKWSTSIRQIDSDNPIILNVYQTTDEIIPVPLQNIGLTFTFQPYKNLLEADNTLGQQLISNIDLMSFDIYPDHWTLEILQGALGVEYNEALIDASKQIDLAENNFSFDGRWGISELPAGPKENFLLTPGFFLLAEIEPADTSDMITSTKLSMIGGKPPALITPFQLREVNSGVNASGPNFDDAYGLVEHPSDQINDGTNGTPDFLTAIKFSVEQNCPGPILTVIKNVINDDGGTKSPEDFTIHVTGNSPSPDTFSGDASGTEVMLGIGNYDVTEDSVAGYTSSFSDDCSSAVNGPLDFDDRRTCTIINDDELTIGLTIIKNVINNNDGTSDPSDFTISVIGNNPSPSLFPGDSSGTFVTLDPGDYTVIETGPNGYIGTYSADCSGTFNENDTKTCTITNDDLPPAEFGVLAVDVSPKNGGNACNVGNAIARDGAIAGLDYRILGFGTGGLGKLPGTNPFVSGCIAVGFDEEQDPGPITVTAGRTDNACGKRCTGSNCDRPTERFHVFSSTDLSTYSLIGSSPTAPPNPSLGPLRDYAFSVPSTFNFIAVCRSGAGPAASDVMLDSIVVGGFSSTPLPPTPQPGGPYFYPELNQTSINATKPEIVTVPLKVEWESGYYASPVTVEINNMTSGISSSVTSVQNATHYQLFDMIFNVTSAAQVGEHVYEVLVTEISTSDTNSTEISVNVD